MVMMMKAALPTLAFLTFCGWSQVVSGDLGPKPTIDHTKGGVGARVVGIESSVPSSASIANLIEGASVELHKGIKFAKFVLYFEPALSANKVELESCSSDFVDGVEFFASPGTRRVYAEGGARVVKADFGSRLPDITSLAINLRGNHGPCLKSLRFLQADGVKVDVAVSTSALADRSLLDAKNFDRNQGEFERAGLGSVVNQELVPESEDEEKWILRLRGDGTFFMFGRSDDLKAGSRFSAIGNFEIQSVQKNRIRLLLRGYRFTTPEPWDGGWSCHSDCLAPLPSTATRIDEPIEIEKLSKGGYMIRNRSRSKQRTLPFTDMRVNTSAL